MSALGCGAAVLIFLIVSLILIGLDWMWYEQPRRDAYRRNHQARPKWE